MGTDITLMHDVIENYRDSHGIHCRPKNYSIPIFLLFDIPTDSSQQNACDFITGAGGSRVEKMHETGRFLDNVGFVALVQLNRCL